jgi:nitrogenase molybdenum-cofactor synthesis protein NifE
MSGAVGILEGRKNQIFTVSPESSDIQNNDNAALACSKASLAGSVSQRACVFCGSRVVLYPIADAVHLVHGPVGCAAYTWDIRGAVSSGPQLHRLSFCSDLREKDVVFGGEPRLYQALKEAILRHSPAAAFVYSTCIVGLIGDDVQSVCRKVAKEFSIPVIPVHSEGFKGTKKDGYKAACEALLALIGTRDTVSEKYQDKPELAASPFSINILGEFNLAGEAWIIKNYYEEMGIRVNAILTGDSRVEEIRGAHLSALNVVQCSGSMQYLAKEMQERWGIPFMHVSYFGLDDMADSLYRVADFFTDAELMRKTTALVSRETQETLQKLQAYRKDLAGKKAAIYVGGAFKARSLVKALRLIGVSTVLVGSQTGNPDDYKELAALCDPGTVLVDDSNPAELSRFVREKGADIFIGGVKERPVAYKLGLAFCDHNHERKIPLAGFEGMIHFAAEVHRSAMSPVWKLLQKERASCQN